MQDTELGILLFSIATSIIWGLWAGALARERNRNPWAYALFAAAFPLAGVITAARASRRPEPRWLP